MAWIAYGFMVQVSANSLRSDAMSMTTSTKALLCPYRRGPMGYAAEPKKRRELLHAFSIGSICTPGPGIPCGT